MRLLVLCFISLFLFACEAEESAILPEEETPPNQDNPSTLVVEIEETTNPCDQILFDETGNEIDCPDRKEQE